jgi:hypothetical protein
LSLNVFSIIGLLILDLSVYIFCGLFMMGYDDFYDESQGEYFSFSSMEMKYKVVYVFSNFWLILNGILLLYFLFNLYKKLILKRHK